MGQRPGTTVPLKLGTAGQQPATSNHCLDPFVTDDLPVASNGAVNGVDPTHTPALRLIDRSRRLGPVCAGTATVASRSFIPLNALKRQTQIMALIVVP